MFTPTLYQRIVRKGINSLAFKKTAPLRRRCLNNTDFSIISNNCWGGICYEFFDLPKLSPTVGCWFFADEYLRFVSNLKYYLSQQINIVKPEEAPCYNKLIEMNSTGGLVGILDDIQVVMLHYHDAAVALEKWNRRVDRINFNNLVIKFSYMNDCTYDMLKQFDEMDLSHISENAKKVMFVPRPMPEFKSAIYVKGFENEKQITNDTYVFNQYLDIYSFLNGKGLKQRGI